MGNNEELTKSMKESLQKDIPKISYASVYFWAVVRTIIMLVVIALEDLFRSKNESKRVQKGKPLYSEKPSFSSSFHIDRKVPNGGYGDNGNCVLACAFCNNAKSDMVKDADEFKSAFGIAIFSFYTALLDKRESIEMEENHKKIDKLMEWAKEKLGIERFNKLFK